MARALSARIEAIDRSTPVWVLTAAALVLLILLPLGWLAFVSVRGEHGVTFAHYTRVFTDPPLAHSGLSERDAQRQSIAVRVATLPMEAVLRTHTTGETSGFMKVLVGASDDHVLGFTMIGSEAGEVMTAIQTAMLARLPYTILRDAVIAHLTVAEGLGLLLGNVPPG